MMRTVLTIFVDTTCLFTILVLSNQNYWLLIPAVILSLNAKGGAR